MKRYIEIEETADKLRGLFFCARNFVTGRGGSNLYGRMPRKTAPPLACKKGDFKRVIKEAVKNHADKIE
jgi:hypothetical protein